MVLRVDGARCNQRVERERRAMTVKEAMYGKSMSPVQTAKPGLFWNPTLKGMEGAVVESLRRKDYKRVVTACMNLIFLAKRAQRAQKRAEKRGTAA